MSFQPPTLGGCAALWKQSSEDVTPDFRDTYLHWYVQHSPASIALLAHVECCAAKQLTGPTCTKNYPVPRYLALIHLFFLSQNSLHAA